MLPLHPWVRKCLDYLDKLPQIRAVATTEPYIGGEILTDGKLTLTTQNEGQEINYLFVIKPDITREVLEDVQLKYLYYLRQRLDASQRLLLISKDLSNYAVDRLLEENIEFLDINGTVYLNNSGFYILIRQINLKKNNYKNQKIMLTDNNLKVMFGLLTQQKQFDKLNNIHPHQPLIPIDGFKVHPKTIINSLDKLVKLKYLRRKKNYYEIVDFHQFFGRWESGYVEILRPSLLIDSFRFQDHSLLSKNLDQLINYCQNNNLVIGGELGGELITNYLKPITAVLHLPPDINYRKIMIDLRLIPDPQGNITLLRHFVDRKLCDNNDQYPIADPLLIHAELRINPDSRIKEMANIIYEKKIASRFYQ